MIPLAAILARIADGASFREVATEYRLGLPLARALWEAHVLGGAPAMVRACAKCAGGGATDGEPCKTCRGSGLGDGA